MLEQTPSRPWFGAAWKIIAFACYAALNTLARYLSGGSSTDLEQTLPVNVILFFQDTFALLFMLPWILHNSSALLKPRFITLHFIRVILSVSAIISWYFALFFIPQAQAVALSILGPLIGVVGAKWFLKERISWQRSTIIFSSFCLAWILMHPVTAFLANQNTINNQNNNIGLVCIVLSIFLFAAAKVITRKLAHAGESPRKLTAYLLILIVPFSLVPALFVWVMPSMVHLPWLVLGGLLTTIAIYAVSMALSHAEISFLAPFDFIQFILNAAMGYWIFTETPSTWVLWIIAAIILFSVSSLLPYLNQFRFRRL